MIAGLFFACDALNHEIQNVRNATGKEKPGTQRDTQKYPVHEFCILSTAIQKHSLSSNWKE